MPWYEVKRPPFCFEVEQRGGSTDPVVEYTWFPRRLTKTERQSRIDYADSFLFFNPERLKEQGHVFHTMKIVKLPPEVHHRKVEEETLKLRVSVTILRALGVDPQCVIKGHE